jgi:hypothetical protein
MSGGWRIGTGNGVAGGTRAAVRHSAGAVGETVAMHRVSDRAKRRARAQWEWVA